MLLSLVIGANYDIPKSKCGGRFRVEEIYNDIHTEEENGKLTIGWIRGIYPTRATAEGALERGKLFVLEDKGRVVGAGIINQDQAEAYAQGRWVHELPPELQGLSNVSMVLLEKYLG